MSHEVEIHQTQTTILRELLFKPQATFSELQKTTDLDSDHFKFHIKRLVEIGYVLKSESGEYSLSQTGKEYANKIDTDNGVIERQPKSAVIIVLFNNKKEVLVQERLKHPYFGFWGYPGGKIKWGETIAEAADRELNEETGLVGDLEYRGVYHEQVESAETGKQLEDKIFHVFGGSLRSGLMVKEFDGGRNAWMSFEELAKLDKKYASFDIETDFGLGKLTFLEKKQIYKKDEF